MNMSLAIIFVGTAMLATGIVLKGKEHQEIPVARMELNSTICQSHPFGTPQDKWQRMTVQNQHMVIRLKAVNRAETSIPKTLECRDINKPGKHYYLRETWWRRIPAKPQHRACGDYTKPEVPNIKVVAV